MSEKLDDYNIENKKEFFSFVLDEFQQTSKHASVEELAEFAFGSIKEAAKEFIEHKGKN